MNHVLLKSIILSKEMSDAPVSDTIHFLKLLKNKVSCMAIDKTLVQNALQTVVDPFLKTDYVSANCVKSISVQGETVEIALVLGFPATSYHDTIKNRIESAICQIPSVKKVIVTIETNIITHATRRGVKPLENIKNIIAISSGKGGVGKSTLTTNLALALRHEGAVVGILDADIYGPSQPLLMGVSEKPTTSDGTSMNPIGRHGIQLMSIGLLMDDVSPLVWRSPMIIQAVMQLLEQTAWRNVDYLLIDMPPGTGDIQLTLAQQAPLTGALVVTTPQEVAVLDAKKGLMMFQKLSVEILGILENMSGYLCPHCGQIEPIFGKDGAQIMAKTFGVDVLGQIPINTALREQSDLGRPIVLADDQQKISKMFIDAAIALATKISLLPKDRMGKIPTVVKG